MPIPEQGPTVDINKTENQAFSYSLGKQHASVLSLPKLDLNGLDAEQYAEGYYEELVSLQNRNQISVNQARKYAEELSNVTSRQKKKPFKELLDQVDEIIKDHDPVHHPSHYTFGKYEVIDVLFDWQLAYPLDNVVKYTARAGKKSIVDNQELEDLEKARFYLDYYIAQKGGQSWNPAQRVNDGSEVGNE